MSIIAAIIWRPTIGERQRHVLSALRRLVGPDHPSVTKVIGFLDRTQAAWPFWFESGIASPYYPTPRLCLCRYQEELTLRP